MIFASESVVLAVNLRQMSIPRILYIFFYYMWLKKRSIFSVVFEGRIHHLLQRKKPLGLAPVAI